MDFFLTEKLYLRFLSINITAGCHMFYMTSFYNYILLNKIKFHRTIL